MTIHKINQLSAITVSQSTLPLDAYPGTSSLQTNELGETPLPFAPLTTLANGHMAVPQQYLQVHRSLENLEFILSDIEFSDQFILFAGQNADELYLQVGIVGVENYPHTPEESQLKKIVYGRRWVIEPSTPTSEVIQTAMLGIKKAREHELREKFTLRINQLKNTTTPFNNHMDLPLMSGNQSLLKATEKLQTMAEFAEQLKQLLPAIAVDSMQFSLEKILELNAQQTIISLRLKHEPQAKTLFPELLNTPISFICNKRSQGEFLHALIDQLVNMSDRYVEENFRYQDFARFSHDLCPIEIADFSYQTRNIQSDDQRFDSSFKNMSYSVDAAKTPYYSQGKLGSKQRRQIKQCNVQGGHFPKENLTESRVLKFNSPERDL